ncbi:MAG: ATP-grasp domain-containing protein [Nitrospiraceae bacterium]|nr:MAG: ATP-grasp domain-containing protein [Nitrospiraceae bacterium]
MTCADKKRVLILDGMWNKSLAVVRSFGKRGFFVAAGEKTRFATALFSKYCSRRIVYPSPVEKSAGFLDWLEAELKEYRYDVIFPTELSTQNLLTEHSGRFARYCKIPFADTALCMKLQDKAFLMEYARQKKLDIPLTRIVHDLSGLDKLKNKLDFPVVIKPRASSGSRGIVYVKNRKDFAESYCKVHNTYPFPIIQEYIPKGGGGAIGVCLLLNNESEVWASFVYRRLREYPVEGGPSTLRESIKRDDVKNIAESILRDFRWTGVAHVEFIIDPRDGKPKLLEVNPRFWGSLQLAIEAGVDFPYLLYQLAVKGDVEPVHDYRTGVMCRFVVPGDLLHFLYNPDRFKMKPGFFNMTIKDDIFSLKDPLPLLGRVSSVFSFLSDREMRGIIRR